MNFWKKVCEELSYRNIERKDLASQANFPVSYISKGLARQSIPSADLAVRIANSLNVSVEYLLEIDIDSKDADENRKEKHLYNKYKYLIELCERLSEENKLFVEELAKRLQN